MQNRNPFDTLQCETSKRLQSAILIPCHLDNPLKTEKDQATGVKTFCQSTWTIFKKMTEETKKQSLATSDPPQIKKIRAKPRRWNVSLLALPLHKRSGPFGQAERNSLPWHNDMLKPPVDTDAWGMKAVIGK